MLVLGMIEGCEVLVLVVIVGSEMSVIGVIDGCTSVLRETVGVDMPMVGVASKVTLIDDLLVFGFIVPVESILLVSIVIRRRLIGWWFSKLSNRCNL